MIEFEIVIAVTLFGIGLFGVTTQKSFLKIFFSLEMLLNSVILMLASTAVQYGISENLSVAYLLIAIATLEAAAGLIIFLVANRITGATEIDKLGDDNAV
jgi:NADH:ubiquinone oxidoreductase subunit K